MRTQILAALILAALPLLAAPAFAHRQPEVDTTVVLGQSEAGPVLQITHRLHAHDAQAVLGHFGAQTPRLSDPENQARLALYVIERFDLSGEGESQVIGVEVEGNYLFVYAEHPAPAGVEGSTILADIDSAWVNFVHLKDQEGDTVQTVTFRQGEDRLDGTPLVPPGAPGQ